MRFLSNLMSVSSSVVTTAVVALALVGCTKGSKVDDAAMDFANSQYETALDQMMDSVFGKDRTKESHRDEFRAYLKKHTDIKVSGVEKKSETESEVSLVVETLDNNEVGGIILLGAFGAGLDGKKGFDPVALIEKLEKEKGQKIKRMQKPLKFVATLENEKWTFKEAKPVRGTASKR